MKHTDPFPERQLRTLYTAALLSPILRLIPGSAAVGGGRAAWLGPLVAIPLLLLYAWLLSHLRRGMRPGETLAPLCLRVFGARLGRLALLLLGAWLLFYTGFVLRAGAERFVVTIFPHSAQSFFVLSMGLLGLLAALGSLQSLVRVARIVAPILFFVLLAILLVAFGKIDKSELLPLSLPDGPALLGSAWPSLDILSFGLAVPCFFHLGQATAEHNGFRISALWLGGMVLFLTALGAAVQGRFGAALCVRLSTPFFALVRNLVFFRSLERLEALVVGLWLFPDFLLAGMVLHAAQTCLRLAVGKSPQPGEKRLDLQNGRWIIWLCGAAAAIIGLFIAPSPAALRRLSTQIVPLCSLAVAFGFLPLLYGVGKRKKLL